MTIHNLFADQMQILRDAILGKIDLEKEHPFLSRQLQLCFSSRIYGLYEKAKNHFMFVHKRILSFIAKIGLFSLKAPSDALLTPGGQGPVLEGRGGAKP